MRTRDIGERGERIARDLLEKKGYALIAENYSWRGGEIDLIAFDDDVLVFVEVKARKDDRYGRPSEYVDRRKQKKIIETSEVFQLREGYDGFQVRYDVVEILWNTGEVNHIVNAFP